jgi:hypothetical protein
MPEKGASGSQDNQQDREVHMNSRFTRRMGLRTAVSALSPAALLTTAAAPAGASTASGRASRLTTHQVNRQTTHRVSRLGHLPPAAVPSPRSRLGTWGRRTLALAALPVIAATAVLATSPASAQASVTPAVAPRHAAGHGRPDTSFPPGTFTFVNYNSSLCLGINGSGDAGQWPCTYVNDQAWHQGAQYGNSGYFQVINVNGQCLGVSGASRSQGARVVGFRCISSHPDQYWTVNTSVTCIKSGITFYPIINKNSGQVLGVAGNSLSRSAAVVQWPYQSICNNQFWAFANP